MRHRYYALCPSKRPEALGVINRWVLISIHKCSCLFEDISFSITTSKQQIPIVIDLSSAETHCTAGAEYNYGSHDGSDSVHCRISHLRGEPSCGGLRCPYYIMKTLSINIFRLNIQGQTTLKWET